MWIQLTRSAFVISSMLFFQPMETMAKTDEGWITHSVAISPQHDTIVRGRFHNERGISQLWIEDARSGALSFDLKAWGVIRGFAFDTDGKLFVASADHGPLKVIEAQTGKVVSELKGHSGWVYTVAFGNGIVASAGRDETVRVWDSTSGVELWSKQGVSIGRVAVSPDGIHVAGTDQFGNLCLWDAKTGNELGKFDTGESQWGFQLAFSRDGKFVAGGSRRVGVFGVETGKKIGTVDVHNKNRCSAIAVLDGGTRLATAGPDNEVKVWRVSDSTVEFTWRTPRSVGALSFAADGRTLCAAQYSGQCHVWNLETGFRIEPDDPSAPWIETDTDTNQLLLSIAFFDTWRGVAVGGNTETGPSLIMISVDDGQSWYKTITESVGRLYDVDVLDNTTALAVGYGGLVLKTEDRGETWRKIESPNNQWLAGVDFVDSRIGYVVGGSSEHPVIWKSTDSGNTWVSIHERLPASARNNSLRDVKFVNKDRGFAAGTDGLLIETNDGGETWQQHATGTEAWLRGIFVNGMTIHVAGKGVLLRSEDDGKTWCKLPIPDNKKLNDVVFVNDTRGWITNFDGEILETRDAGKTWKTIHTHSDTTGGIHASSERTLITTGNGKILRQRR